MLLLLLLLEIMEITVMDMLMELREAIGSVLGLRMPVPGRLLLDRERGARVRALLLPVGGVDRVGRIGTRSFGLVRVRVMLD